MNGALQSILAALASFLLVTLIFATILYFCRRGDKRRGGDRSELPAWARRSSAPPKPNPAADSRISSASVGESATFDRTLEHVSMKELVEVTRGFSSDLIIGDGSFGLVYKARLNSGPVVALKKLSADAFQGLREFRAEMETLGKIKHPNIVKILGYCATGNDRVLIYEFIEKGSLDQWLYDTSSSSPEDQGHDSGELRLPLSWQSRTKIIKGVALGLAYMHNLDIPIIHRDIKASNILLDTSFEAHIADFGLARQIEGSHSHVSTQVAGTMGYMPPEYLHGAAGATVMGDVYSFGVLMLEIVSGRRPSLPFLGEDGKEVRLMDWIRTMVEQNRYMEILDIAICRDDLKENIVVDVLKMGLKCADERHKVRPNMMEIVGELDKILPQDSAVVEII
ncbi:leucine-rich repeat receptor protein kinase EMS1 [Andrographis paniculata]|uniref:leucine-rich repeat receptor protein kinase EMS1 n=1 Tax=Andrographis paniculata TaxID=175694 RepID=UPI0021E94477|nr:leucine-rich repeat receptor protein kinase EMS1 [Andrographis paniculata]